MALIGRNFQTDDAGVRANGNHFRYRTFVIKKNNIEKTADYEGKFAFPKVPVRPKIRREAGRDN